MLSDSDSEVRTIAIRSLPQFTSNHAEAHTLLMLIASDETHELHPAALESLANMLKKSSDGDQNAAAKLIAREMISIVSDANLAITLYRIERELRDVMEDFDESVVSEINEILIPGLQGDRPFMFARTIAGGGKKSSTAIEPLTGLIANSALLMQCRLGPLLVKIEGASEKVLPIYRRGLQSDNKDTVKAAISAIRPLGIEASLLIEDLVSVIAESSPREQMSIIHTLGRIGPHARSALPVLHELAQLPESPVARAAIRAINKIGI